MAQSSSSELPQCPPTPIKGPTPRSVANSRTSTPTHAKRLIFDDVTEQYVHIAPSTSVPTPDADGFSAKGARKFTWDTKDIGSKAPIKTNKTKSRLSNL